MKKIIFLFSLCLILSSLLFLSRYNHVNAMSEAVRNLNQSAFSGFAPDKVGEGAIPATMDAATLQEGANYAFKGTGIVRSIPESIGKIIGAGLAFIGVLFLLLMIYGGVVWMTARGNEQAVGKAKELIQAAVIGLVIILSAYALTSFLGSSFAKN